LLTNTDGEEYLGVTTHYIVKEVDAGELIFQEKVFVKNMQTEEIYELLFGVVEPFVVTKALEMIINKHFNDN